MDPCSKESKIWDRFSEFYNQFIQKTLGNTYAKLYDQIISDISRKECALEVATGTGLIAFKIAKHLKHIDAVDFSKQMIEVAKKAQVKNGVNNIDFICCNAYNLPFSNGEFDMIIASNLLHLLNAPNIALEEMRRVLKDNGKIILPTFCHGENSKSKLISFLMGLSGFKIINKWSINSYKNFIENNGYEIIKQKVIAGKIPLVYLLVENKIHTR